MIELTDVTCELTGKKILDNVSLKIPEGQTMVIVGSSGAGKSVTLKHIIGLMAPDSGKVLVNDKCIHDVKARELENIRNHMGILFQSGALINWMSIFDNIALPLREKTDLDESSIADKVRERLAMVDMQGTGEKMPSEVSGGMKKRAGLARAIVRDPAIILYDEPTSGLDPVLSRSIDTLIAEMQKRLNVTSIVVTHDLNTAYYVGDRIAMLHEGQIIINATPKDFAENKDPVVQKFVEAQHLAQT